ncbi:tautomerase family protein [Rhodanobacter sp. L36]|uniref:tautomerase family protein n=1 Tax=Rhodanobacter sp. L36 TaxID=1747221 RepID=UPI00131DAAFA|nr:tautomerase family protein [Rhodanobacter sp. L36]
MPIINVQLLAGRSAQQKDTFMKEVAAIAMRTLQVPEHVVTIVLTEVEREHWSVGMKSMTEIQAARLRE